MRPTLLFYEKCDDESKQYSLYSFSSDPLMIYTYKLYEIEKKC